MTQVDSRVKPGPAVADRSKLPLRAVTSRSTERDASGATVPALEYRSDGQLIAHAHGEAVPVRLCRCFPWSASARYISLRDAENREVALIREPAALDSASRSALEQALVEASMVFEVMSVERVEDDFEIRLFRVRTRSGLRTFQTARDTFLRPSESGGWLVEDVQGDIFWVPPAERLDRHSRRQLWALID